MWIDVTVLILLVMAAVKGFRRGLVVAVFSFVALFIGLAAALKLSAILANYLREKSQMDSTWWPILAFGLIFIAVLLIVRWAAKIVEKSVEFALLGWVNRIGGFLLYAIMYLLIFSIVLFYVNQARFINENTKSRSNTYSLIEPWGPKTINGLGKVIPIFKNVFSDLQQFFEEAGSKIKTKTSAAP
jgi:membrane protein required for colicin V production